MSKRTETPVLRVVTRTHLVGFQQAVDKFLRNESGRAPTADSVRKVLKNERQSRTLLLRIFENAPDLLQFDGTAAEVRDLYRQWKERGTIPETYNWKRGAGEHE